MNQTQDTILQYLEKETLAFIDGLTHHCDTNAISDFLFLSRSSTSQYLNNMVNEGKLIKIKERPVIFLNREVLETQFHIAFEETTFEDNDTFFDRFNSLTNQTRNFAKMIGYDTSLKYCVIQCQAAMKYPPASLPVLLYGEPGCGKKMLARLMYEYTIDEGILKKGDPFYLYQCKPHTKDERDLFGYLENGKLIEGLFHKIKKGMLFFNHAEFLSEQAKEKLSRYIRRDNRSFAYHEKEISREIRLVFASEQKQNEWAHDYLFQRIPVTVYIPSLKERFPEDRKRMIHSFIREEANNMKEDIYISSTLLNTLLNAELLRNVESLKSIIKICCANALQSSQSHERGITLFQYHLPSEILSTQAYRHSFSEDNHLISLDQLNIETEIQRIFFFYDKILRLYQTYLLEHDDRFFADCSDLINEYFDHLVFNKKYINDRINSIESALASPLEQLENKYNLSLHTNYAYILARIIYLQLYYGPSLHLWEHEHSAVNEFYAQIQEEYAQESGIIKELSSLITQTIDVTVDKMNTIFLIFDMHFLNDVPLHKMITGIILSHGYSTASSIADASNRLLGKHIYEAIDMPLDISISEIVAKLSRYFINNYVGDEVILLVDMGSLENIGTLMKSVPNSSIGIINNISTKVALDIGEKIMQGKAMEDILISTCKETILKYQIIAKQRHEYAIVFTTETGMTATDRIIQLFKSSLPSKKEINIVPYDYYELSQHLEHDDLFKKYTVLFISGTMRIEIPNIPFIALEDIISFNNIDMVNHLMEEFFTNAEIEQFNQSLMRNFSMYNVLNYITILNPDRLLSFVEKAVNQLESQLSTKFSNKIRIGMYIHISCLIERLVTKTAITAYEDIEGFEERQADFIAQVKDSFAEISKHYNVSIPTTEIAYLYAYINSIAYKEGYE